ncbi:MAG: polysaccharide deacetylase family protein [Nanoarchaeota archaeon]|nr:polysaccharide deacetylase family protein [Nanoarchaeota archaeon]
MVKKIAYLTIDDAPSEDMKMKVDFLESKGIKAIWFCRGELLSNKANQEAVIYAIRKGHIIGNHAFDHPHFSKLSLEECFEQIKKTDELIDSIYEMSEIKRPIKVFRFPYLDKGAGSVVEQGWPEDRKEHIQAIQDFLKRLGYVQPKFEGITYRWFLDAGLLKDVDVQPTYDTHDYSPFQDEPTHGIDSLEKVMERIEEDVPEECRGLNYPDSNEIIMMHDNAFTNRELSNKIFFAIIERLIEKGITFKLPETND